MNAKQRRALVRFVGENATGPATERAAFLVRFELDYHDRKLGFSREEAMAALGWSTPFLFQTALREARRTLAETPWAFVCAPRGSGQPWRYRLTDVGFADKDVEKWWHRQILGTLVQLDTEGDVASAALNASEALDDELVGLARRAKRVARFLAEEAAEYALSIDLEPRAAGSRLALARREGDSDGR